jgi:sugar (pentulose or hexulose) kinase
MMVQLMADACGLPVILSDEANAGSVVLGAAMLGRYAAEVKEGGGDNKRGERFWQIMVRICHFLRILLKFVNRWK